LSGKAQTVNKKASELTARTRLNTPGFELDPLTLKIINLFVDWNTTFRDKKIGKCAVREP
jgi:hypothetical protein